ncbi:MAG TPA: Mrp/NBP35 family ATP-binding protein [Gemmatimonadales bacterium]|nr:Mrp/NBP35 family ATP-binding protein [Gemmatimonadales bacterium]
MQRVVDHAPPGDRSAAPPDGARGQAGGGHLSPSLEAAVGAALARLRNPRLDNDLLSAGMIRDLAVTPDGGVSFTFLLSRDDPATLVREARNAVKAVDGVRPDGVKITVTDPAGPPKATHAPPGAGPQSAGSIPAQQPREQANLGRIIAVSSGKGGVGKSTVSANLAIALARQGHRVGLMDADIYGPNIPRMFGSFEKPVVIAGRIRPLDVQGVKLMSIGFLVERDAPAIWRGPIIMKVIQQFLRDVDWGELDYFLVDMPPGTGDAQLSLVQSVAVSGAVIVTTPQEMAVGDALKGALMFERVGVPVLGVVENMGPYVGPAGVKVAFFGEGGGQRLADEVGVPLLGSIPLQSGLAQQADAGIPIVVAEPATPAALALLAVAERVHAQAGARAMSLPVINQ